jgi:hypothetical protein
MIGWLCIKPKGNMLRFTDEDSERRSSKIFGVCDRTVVTGQSVISVLRWILFLCKQVFKIKCDTVTVLRDLHCCCMLLLEIFENVKAPGNRWSGCSSQCMSFGFSDYWFYFCSLQRSTLSGIKLRQRLILFLFCEVKTMPHLTSSFAKRTILFCR